MLLCLYTFVLSISCTKLHTYNSEKNNPKMMQHKSANFFIGSETIKQNKIPCKHKNVCSHVYWCSNDNTHLDTTDYCDVIAICATKVLICLSTSQARARMASIWKQLSQMRSRYCGYHGNPAINREYLSVSPALLINNNRPKIVINMPLNIAYLRMWTIRCNVRQRHILIQTGRFIMFSPTIRHVDI